MSAEGVKGVEPGAAYRRRADFHEIPFQDLLGAPFGRSGAPTHLALARRGEVRALIPLGSRDATRAALSEQSTGAGPVRAFAQEALARGVSGAAGRLLPDRFLVHLETRELQTQVSELLGIEKTLIAWRFGPPRANRKPVGQVLSYDGETRAFLKIGAGPIAGALITAESRTLSGLVGAVPGLRIPEVLGDFSWRGVPALLQSPVRGAGERTPPSDSERAVAEAAIIATGTQAITTLGPEQPLIRQLVEALEPLGARAGGAAAGLAGALAGLGDTPVRLGGSHGDWSVQNMCASSFGVAVWDWERYATGRPAGWDALHYRAAMLLAAPSTRSRAGRLLLAESPGLLGQHQPGLTAAQARLVAGLYLVAMLVRYATEGQQHTSSPASAFGTWLLPALHDLATGPASR